MDKFLVKPEKFGAVDALGRKLPDVGKKRPGKYVGLFYWTWHTHHAKNRVPRNNTEITARYPEAVNDFDHPAWEGTGEGYPHFWGEPVYGYYVDNDEYVVRRNAELITNAGVDVIFFDCTNGDFLWDDDYKFLAKVYKKAIKQGVNVPKVAFMLNFCPVKTSNTMLHRVYDDFYSDKENEDLFFYWEGKPIIMAHPECLDPSDPKEKEILDFFTFRSNEPTYFAADTKYEQDKKWWGWCSVYPQTKYGVRDDGSVEQMTVNVAQNANDQGLHAMNTNGGEGVYGRSYAKGEYSYSYDRFGKTFTVDKENTENLSLYGLNFQQQWDYALKVDPDFVFITGWNELIAGRFRDWLGTPNAFPDQFDFEHSRDIEPSKTVLGDNYYYQLVSNIRRFKYEPAESENTTDTEFYGYEGSGLGRDNDGWKGCRYVTQLAENSVIYTKISSGDGKIVITAECEKEITNPELKLLIRTGSETDKNSWEGFSYIVNRCGDGHDASIEKSLGGYTWEKIGTANIKVAGKTITFEIPLSLAHFGFKWISGAAENGDFSEVYTKGQAVPCGRFFYQV